jgi:hypothetical protein
MNPPGDFEVSVSGVTRELLIRLHDQAAEAGLRLEFLAAVRAVLSRLRANPDEFGEELFDLRVLRLTVKVGVVLPAAVEFVVIPERRLVVVRTFRFVPPGA